MSTHHLCKDLRFERQAQGLPCAQHTVDEKYPHQGTLAQGKEKILKLPTRDKEVSIQRTRIQMPLDFPAVPLEARKQKASLQNSVGRYFCL